MSLVADPPATDPGPPDPAGGRGRKGSRRTGAGPASRRRRSSSPATAVNLLSPWVLEELRVRRLRLRFAVGALALVVLAGASYGLLRLSLSRAEQGLDDEHAIAVQLESQIEDLGAVRTYVNDVGIRATDVEDTMSQEVALSRVLEALEAALPDGAAYDSFEVSLPPAALVSAEATAGSVVCPGPDPFAVRQVVGCVTLSGTAGSRDDVSTLVQALARSELFVEPFVNTTTTSEGEDGAAGTVQFIGSLGLDPASLTGRYADVDGSEAEEQGAARTEKKGRGR